MGASSNTTGDLRDGQGRFAPGNKAAVGHDGKGTGRPASEVKAMLREEGLAALERLKEIARDPGHKEYGKVNLWLTERGLVDDLKAQPAPGASGMVLPAWGEKEAN